MVLWCVVSVWAYRGVLGLMSMYVGVLYGFGYCGFVGYYGVVLGVYKINLEKCHK